MYLSGSVRWQLSDYGRWSRRLDKQGLLGISLSKRDKPDLSRNIGWRVGDSGG